MDWPGLDAENDRRRCMAVVMLGREAEAAGRLAEAASRYRRALTLDPADPAGIEGLARVLDDCGTGPALPAAARAARLRPDNAAARRRLAQWLSRAGRTADAESEWREFLHLTPADPPASAALARLLLARDEPAAAAAVLLPALRADPADVPARLLLARAWFALGETARGRDALDRARAGADAAALAEIAALADAAEGLEPATITPLYVRTLFDGYADRFDTALTTTLDYQAPALIAGALARFLGPAAADRDILDLGCGTGLAAPGLRPYARRLVGVDLSPRMLDQARARGLYDRLVEGDLLAALAAADAAWDLAVAADVLVYLGDLGPVFAAARKAVRPGGLLIATTERLDADGFILGPTRRYAHGAPHIRAAADGWELMALEPVVPRRERGGAVRGWLVVLRCGDNRGAAPNPAGASRPQTP